MIKFTKEEISLCKQVAKRHRKEISKGDWMQIYKPFADLRLLIRPSICQFGRFYDAQAEGETQVMIADKNEYFPLWTLSDCLEFLEEKGWNAYDMSSWSGEAHVKIVYIKPGKISKELKFWADTLLVACLKAVLAVLEEEKK